MLLEVRSLRVSIYKMRMTVPERGYAAESVTVLYEL